MAMAVVVAAASPASPASLASLVQPRSTALASRSSLGSLSLGSPWLPPKSHLKPPRNGAARLATWSSKPQTIRASLEALVFDCDGVILESEDLHRRAYNAAFHEFNVRTPAAGAVLVWTPEFYDELQNTIGGGKPKMRWYFSKYGWPTSTILPTAPSNEEEQAILIDTIQDWKTEKYKNFIGSGDVEPRPGVLELMDATREKGLKLAVCSAATKSSVIFTLSNLLGKERFEGLDCFLAGDDVDKKKPDPTIYIKAAETLGVAPENCLVVEDSVIGLKVV